MVRKRLNDATEVGGEKRINRFFRYYKETSFCGNTFTQTQILGCHPVTIHDLKKVYKVNKSFRKNVFVFSYFRRCCIEM